MVDHRYISSPNRPATKAAIDPTVTSASLGYANLSPDMARIIDAQLTRQRTRDQQQRHGRGRAFTDVLANNLSTLPMPGDDAAGGGGDDEHKEVPCGRCSRHLCGWSFVAALVGCTLLLFGVAVTYRVSPTEARALHVDTAFAAYLDCNDLVFEKVHEIEHELEHDGTAASSNGTTTHSSSSSSSSSSSRGMTLLSSSTAASNSSSNHTDTTHFDPKAFEVAYFELCRAPYAHLYFFVSMCVVFVLLSYVPLTCAVAYRPKRHKAPQPWAVWCVRFALPVNALLVIVTTILYLSANGAFAASWSECSEYAPALWTALGGHCGDLDGDVIGDWLLAFNLFFVGAGLLGLSQLLLFIASVNVIGIEMPAAAAAAAALAATQAEALDDEDQRLLINY
jgi:hypothetical protein